MRSEGVLDLNCSAVVMHLYAVYCFKMFIFYFFFSSTGISIVDYDLCSL